MSTAFVLEHKNRGSLWTIYGSGLPEQLAAYLCIPGNIGRGVISPRDSIFPIPRAGEGTSEAGTTS
jgi:hypothetical protein